LRLLRYRRCFGSFQIALWPAGMQLTDGSHHLRNHRCSLLRGRCHCNPSTTLEHLLNHVALFGVQAAELVLNIEAGLTTRVKQVFPFDVQFTSQRINTDFLLQA
jgi:hypothetical protein